MKIPKEAFRKMMAEEIIELRAKVQVQDTELKKLRQQKESLIGQNNKLRSEMQEIAGGRDVYHKLREQIKSQKKSIDFLCVRLNKEADEVKRLRSLSVWGFIKEKLRYGK